MFKSIEELDMHRSQQKKAKAYPSEVMVTRCGGEEGFEKASMWFIFVHMTCNAHDVHWSLMHVTCTCADTVVQ